MKFSKTTGCFYPEWGHYSLPADCVEVSASEFSAAINRQVDATLDVVNGKVVIVPPPDKERERLEASILESANTETNRIIENDFVFAGKPVRLTMEDQKNFQGLWLTRDLQTYPRTIKVGSVGLNPVLHTFNSASELHQFFLAGLAHIDNAIMTGVQIKAAAAAKATEQLRTWKDPRKE